jgi:predicted metal-dependent HD superfamily phosphohydrolase
MVSPERLDLLQRQWVRLLEEFGVIPATAYPPFDSLVTAYSEPHRHYHTLEHLAEMFRVVSRLSGSCADPRAVQFAVWFHDAVYDPRASDNEERSALLAAATLNELVIWPDGVGKVIELIRATAHLSETDPTADPDAIVLLDADLAILAASETRYHRYAADIRKEYTHVPDSAYREGRVAVLERFLARPCIYRHPVMIAEGEESARRNLRTEIYLLRRSMEG